ncbi:hypothetical protein LTR28_001622, partial [Elasticomyces elasticus]
MSNTDVHGSVFSIVAAFTCGLGVFKKLQDERRKKSRARRERVAAAEVDEQLRLQGSLRRGPADIEQEYQYGYRAVGERFAVGDGKPHRKARDVESALTTPPAIAQSSLAATLLKFNTGLINIISSFLTGGREDQRVDYASLTRLSDLSRKETIGSLRELYQRLSQANLRGALLPKPCERCGRLDCDARAVVCAVPAGNTAGKPLYGDKKRNDAPRIARVVIGKTSQSHLALVRPRERRDKSESSTSTAPTTSASNAPSRVSTPATTPCTSPLPAYMEKWYP